MNSPIDLSARDESALQKAHDELAAQLRRTNDELQKEIADRKRAEAALRLSEEQLERSRKHEALGRLAGGLVHDFNNTVSVMLGYAGLLALTLPPDADGQQDVKQIVLAGERAAALIRQLVGQLPSERER